MIRHDRDSGCKPWLPKTYDRNSTANSYEGMTPKQKSNALVLFVRIVQDDKSEMFTLRDLHNGIRIFEVKCKLELYSGIPTNFMEMRSIHNEMLDDSTSLLLGENVSFGETIRVKLNESWNEAMDAVWKGSIPDLKRYLRTIVRKRPSDGRSQYKDLGSHNDLYVEDVLSQALFITCRYGDTNICKLLMKIGANSTYTTTMGNTCLHVASHAGHLPLIQLLFTYGSNIRCRNIRGASPLDIATSRGHFDCARWLWLNQWSASITAERLSVNSQVEVGQQTKTAQDSHFLEQPENKRPITADAKQASCNSSDTNHHSRRPQTAVYTRQLKTLDSKLPTRTSSSQSKSQTSLKQTPDLRRRITLNGLQSNKTKTILAYFASKKEHQKSIPGKEVDFEASVTNANAAMSKSQSTTHDFQVHNTPEIELGKRVDHHLESTSASATQLRDTKHSTKSKNFKVTDAKPSSPTGRYYSDADATQLKDKSGAAPAKFSWESKPKSVDVTSSLPKASLLPFKENVATPPKAPEPSPETGNENARTVTVPTTTIIHFAIPKAEKEPHSGIQSYEVATEQTAIIRQAIESNKSCEVSESTSAKMLDDTESIYIPKEQSMTGGGVMMREGKGNFSFNEFSKDRLSNAGKQQLKTSDTASKIRKAIVRLPSTLNDDVASTSPSDSVQQPAQDVRDSEQVFQQRVSTPKTVYLQPRSPRTLNRRSSDMNRNGNSIQSNALVEGQRRSYDINKTTSSLSHTRKSTGINKSQSTPIKSNPLDKDKRSSAAEEAARIEKNRKAFETWLTKKRKASEKRKEDETKHRIEAGSRRISSGLTFEEWLRIKKEEETEDDQIANQHESSVKTRKSKIRRQKTYVDWVKEKEEERQNRLDHQRIIEEHTQLKMQEEIAKKKREYQKKRSEWLKKKDELRKHELEQQREKELLEKELASTEQQERLKNRKVKTFEEWASAKEKISKQNRELSKAEKDALAQKEKEEEQKREKLARKKFKLWVKKKEIKKLEEAERELARAKKRTMLLKVDAPLSQSTTPIKSNSFHTSESSQYSDQDIDIDHRLAEFDDDSATNDTEEESIFKISVQITRKSIDDEQ